ncbi:MAG: AraC family transcriptional regulator [Verrucomicrobiales bacterium]|nr:AraC family transcriptional regulator [Verrucomicrobiales bacterium]
MKKSNSVENTLPGYRIFPVDWRIVRVAVKEVSRLESDGNCPRIFVNLDHQSATLSAPSYSIPALHFMVLGPAVRSVKLEGPATVMVADLDALPLIPEHDERPAKVRPLPVAALSLVEALVEESGEVPMVQLVRAVIELLAPCLCEAVEEGKLESFRRYITRHLGEPVSTGDIAAALGLSTARLREMTREIMGMSPASYLREERIQFARDLLATTNVPIELIAERTGYSDRFSFTRAFTAVTGVSPNVYRESMVQRGADY